MTALVETERPQKAAAAVAASLKGVTHRYGKTVALDNVTIAIPAGQMTGLIGPDGVGKSTLLGLIGGRQIDRQLRGPWDGRVCPDITHPAQACLDLILYVLEQLERRLELDAKHELLALGLDLDRLGGELRFGRHERDRGGKNVFRGGVHHHARVVADLEPPRLRAGKVYGRVDVREIDHRRDLAAWRKHSPRLDEAILHPAADRRLDRRVVDHRLQLFDLGVGGLDGRLGFVDLRLGRLEGRIRAIQLLPALVVDFVRGPAFVHQRRRAPHLLVRELQLGVVAGDFSETGCDRLAGERRRGLLLLATVRGLAVARRDRRR